jgi:hypothetical protein
MKKVFILSFVSFCFGFIGLVLWAGSASAQPPFPVPPPGGGIQACYAQQVSPVPQTGQTTMYAAGDDGDIQAGVVAPDPRFTDNGDGTITDNLTHLIWLKDANCLGGTINWQGALDFANGLYDGCTNCGGTNNDCGLSDDSIEGDWRLPNRNELTSLLDLENVNPALPTDHPFMSFQSSFYWSSTTDAISQFFAWFVDFSNGDVDVGGKSTSFDFVLPVRGGS